MGEYLPDEGKEGIFNHKKKGRNYKGQETTKEKIYNYHLPQMMKNF